MPRGAQTIQYNPVQAHTDGICLKACVHDYDSQVLFNGASDVVAGALSPSITGDGIGWNRRYRTRHYGNAPNGIRNLLVETVRLAVVGAMRSSHIQIANDLNLLPQTR